MYPKARTVGRDLEVVAPDPAAHVCPGITDRTFDVKPRMNIFELPDTHCTYAEPMSVLQVSAYQGQVV